MFISKEWRPAYQKHILQIPAGKCYSDTGGGRIEQVHNELQEELGIDGSRIKKLWGSPLTTSFRSIIHIDLVRDLKESKKQPDHGEIIEVVKMPFNDALNYCKQHSDETFLYSLAVFPAKNELNL